MDFTKLKECLDRMISEYHAPGIDCIVYKDHEQIFRYYAGMSDIENNKKVRGDELYIIFSMTKMLTCTCALQLYEKGKFKLDDPVSMYLPEFNKMRITNEALDTESAVKIASGKSQGEKIDVSADGYAQNQITIKDLFTMSAGLDYDLEAKGIVDALKEGKTSTRDLVRSISKTVLGFEPGTRFRYSLCHDVLGALIEVWSGMSFGEYMRKNLFEPIGMTDTFFGVPKDEERLSRMAARYEYDENNNPKRLALECPYTLAEGYESGGAGLISTTEDYALFLDALACGGVTKSGNQILQEETVKLMGGTNHLKGMQLEDFGVLRPGYGYGLGMRTHIDPKVSGSLSPVGEFGWDGAAGAFSLVDPQNKISLTYFQQIHGWDVIIQSEIRNALYECI